MPCSLVHELSCLIQLASYFKRIFLKSLYHKKIETLDWVRGTREALQKKMDKVAGSKQRVREDRNKIKKMKSIIAAAIKKGKEETTVATDNILYR